MPKRKASGNRAPPVDVPPFHIEHPDPDEPASKSVKKSAASGRQAQRAILQASPFTPLGSFKNKAKTLDRYYRVVPSKDWDAMTRYHSFVINSRKYHCEGFVIIAGPTGDEWIARVLEIRASDEHHVYARIYWMYSPDELPHGTRDGTRLIQGRQSYHGHNELIASNHMDIISVLTVEREADVSQWDERNEDDVPKSEFFWRQALDCSNMELSSAESRCKCGRPENPDPDCAESGLTGCDNEDCLMWLHHDCLVHDGLMKIYKRLGSDKPHLPPSPKAKPKETEDSAAQNRLPSPSESGAAPTAEPSINVKADETDSTAAGSPPPIDGKSSSSAKAGPPKSKQAIKGKGRKGTRPYEGLFEAIFKGGENPVLEVKDLRRDVVGGVKEWTEKMNCLVCGHELV